MTDRDRAYWRLRDQLVCLLMRNGETRAEAEAYADSDAIAGPPDSPPPAR